MLKISNLKASVDGKEILKGVDLEIGRGQIHVIMGPNGSGKSTLAQVVMGSSQFSVLSSQFSFNDRDISKLTPDKRAKLGIFLGFQHPVEVPGVSMFNVLRKTVKAGLPAEALAKAGPVSGNRGSTSKADASPIGVEPRNLSQFREQLLEYASSLKLVDDFLRRSLNEGFSGGEKKRSEILQMLALKPKLVILDEIDSGLDVDGLKLVAGAVKKFSVLNPQSSILLITHYARILHYLKPNLVHVMVEGKIVKSGTIMLAKKIEEGGYKAWL